MAFADQLSLQTRGFLDLADAAGNRLSIEEELDREVQAIVKERNEMRVRVDWQFSIPQAREKLSRHYDEVKSKN